MWLRAHTWRARVIDCGAAHIESRKEAKLFSPAKTIWAVMHSGAPAEGYARLKGIPMAALIMHSEAKSDMSALCRNLRSFYVFSYLGSVIPSDINHLAACGSDIGCLNSTCALDILIYTVE